MILFEFCNNNTVKIRCKISCGNLNGEANPLQNYVILNHKIAIFGNMIAIFHYFIAKNRYLYVVFSYYIVIYRYKIAELIDMG